MVRAHTLEIRPTNSRSLWLEMLWRRRQKDRAHAANQTCRQTRGREHGCAPRQPRPREAHHARKREPKASCGEAHAERVAVVEQVRRRHAAAEGPDLLQVPMRGPHGARAGRAGPGERLVPRDAPLLALRDGEPVPDEEKGREEGDERGGGVHDKRACERGVRGLVCDGDMC